MERRSWISTPEEQGIIDRLKERLFPTVIKQWSLFVPVTLMNMTLVPSTLFTPISQGGRN